MKKVKSNRVNVYHKILKAVCQGFWEKKFLLKKHGKLFLQNSL